MPRIHHPNKQPTPDITLGPRSMSRTTNARRWDGFTHKPFDLSTNTDCIQVGRGFSYRSCSLTNWPGWYICRGHRTIPHVSNGNHTTRAQADSEVHRVLEGDRSSDVVLPPWVQDGPGQLAHRDSNVLRNRDLVQPALLMSGSALAQRMWQTIPCR